MKTKTEGLKEIRAIKIDQENDATLRVWKGEGDSGARFNFSLEVAGTDLDVPYYWDGYISATAYDSATAAEKAGRERYRSFPRR